MANQNYKILPNKVELFKFFGTYAPELNVGISSRLPPNGFAVGNEHRAFRTFPDFMKALAELSGLDVDTAASTFRMGTFIIFFNSPLPNPNRRGKTVEATIVPVAESEVMEKAPLSLLDQAKLLNDEADKRGSKDKLAELALANGVTLTKNKSFDNMLADFKTALEESKA